MGIGAVTATAAILPVVVTAGLVRQTWWRARSVRRDVDAYLRLAFADIEAAFATP